MENNAGVGDFEIMCANVCQICAKKEGGKYVPKGGKVRGLFFIGRTAFVEVALGMQRVGKRQRRNIIMLNFF